MDGPRINLARPAVLLVLAFTVLLINGCASPPGIVSETPATPASEDEAFSPEPSIAPTDLPTPEPYVSNKACVDCHTDKELLISTASLVEENKPESSGEG